MPVDEPRAIDKLEPRGGAEGGRGILQQGQIHIFDVHRLLVGQVPWSFLAELFVRGVVIYMILVAIIRLMGKRVAGQLSITELAVIVTLGAWVGAVVESGKRAPGHQQG